MGDAGKVRNQWAWPEYVREEAELDPDNVKIKEAIAAQYGEDALRRSWLAVCKKLEAITQEIKSKGTEIIPEFSYDGFFNMTDAEKEMVKERGCFVIRNTIPKETADAWFQDIVTYKEENKGVITGEDPNQTLVSDAKTDD